MTDEIKVRQTGQEATSAVQSGQKADTGGARCGAERKINRYLYENIVCNLECQISGWTRRAAREPQAEIAQAFRLKAEGLQYALRLLFAFEPEFQELVECAEKSKCTGCGAGLEHSSYTHVTDSDLCDSCYEIGRDEETFIEENARDFESLNNFARLTERSSQ